MKASYKLNDLVRAKRSNLCVGIDPDRIEFNFKNNDSNNSDEVIEKCIQVMRDTADHAVAFKFNFAFFLTATDTLTRDIKKLVDYSKELNVFSIIDFKAGDISNTSKHYAKFAFDIIGADAVTLNPYMGSDVIEPFMNYENKMSFVLAKTSNKPSIGLQDVLIGNEFLYEKSIDMVARLNESSENLGFVVGATDTSAIKKIKKVSKEQWLLIPGVGSQGGDIDEVVEAASQNFIINVSRQIMYSDSPAKSAEFFKEKINTALSK